MASHMPRELHRPRAAIWLALVVEDWAIIIAAFLLARWSGAVVAYWLASLAIGNRMHALGILGHDGSHYCAARRRRLNDTLTAALVFWPLGISLRGYRDFHNRHHRYTGTARDPELAHKAEIVPEFEAPLVPLRLAKDLARDLVGLSAYNVYRIIKHTQPKRRADMVAPVLLQVSVSLALIAAGEYWIPLLWYGALLTSFQACFRLRTWIEHVGTAATHRVELRFWQAALFAPHWTAYHFEHHRWPSVPCWRLAQARTLDRTTPVESLAALLRRLAGEALPRELAPEPAMAARTPSRS